LNRDDIWTALTTSICEVLTPLATINSTDSLQALGANSIDRAEILVLTLNRLQLKIPLIAFAQAKNLQGLVEVFYQSLPTPVAP
jgi:polyketide biosynthesis acyl carrier protein